MNLIKTSRLGIDNEFTVEKTDEVFHSLLVTNFTLQY